MYQYDTVADAKRAALQRQQATACATGRHAATCPHRFARVRVAYTAGR